jgi:hypothetical protein
MGPDAADVVGDRSSQSTIAATTPVCATAPPDTEAPAVQSCGTINSISYNGRTDGLAATREEGEWERLARRSRAFG